jgi:hypothetical protein
MKFWEFVLSLPPDQYIAWVDHTLPDKKTIRKDGKWIEKRIDPFTKPMKVGNITLDRIGSKRNLYQKDIYGIKTYTEFKGRKYPDGIIFFHVSDITETKMHLAMGHMLQIYKKNGWI